MSSKEFKKMDLCKTIYGNNPVDFGIVLSGPMEVPFFNDGAGSAFSNTPLDIQNPEEWRETFEAYIVFDLVNQEHKILSKNQIEKIEMEHEDGYIPFDLGTGKLRATLGLIELAKKTWNRSDKND